MDDQRLKNPDIGGTSAVPDYFDEILARIQDIYESNKAIMRVVSGEFDLKRERTLTPSPSPERRGEKDGFLLRREDRRECLARANQGEVISQNNYAICEMFV